MGRYWPFADILVHISIGIFILRLVWILKLFFKAKKNSWTSDFKWCNHVICPAEGDPLFNW